MSHTVNITLSFLEKLLHNPFNAVQDCGELTPEQVIVHKALVSGGDKCYKIIQYHTLKCSLIEEQETTVSICISDQPTFNLSKESIITVHQLHYNALVASNGKYDLAFYEVALCQLELILFPGNSKSFNKAQEQYETTYKRLLKNEKDKPELFKQFQEYRQTFNELLNADFPENLYQKILGFVKNILTNDFFIHTYYHELEELFVALLGYPIDQVRSSALVLLNCLYDGHLHQLTTPLFLEKILQVGDLLTWTNTFKHPPFASIIKSSSNLVAEITIAQQKRTTFYTPLTLETGVPKHPGEYDMAVGTISNGKFVQCQCSGGFIQSRVIVLPSKAKKTSIFSINLLTTEMIEENNINLVHIVHVSSVQSRTLQCASFEQELIEHIHDLDIPNVGIMVDFPLEISNKQPETSPYRAFMCRKDTESLAENGSYSFLNYRSLASWDFAVEEIKTLQKDCSVDAIRITSICDSLLPIAPLIPEKAKRITCNIVDPQAICGNDSLTFGYPNPLLRKLTKEIWEINPHFSFFVETPEEEIISSIKSSVIPFIDDLKPLWSPSFKTMFQTSSTAQQIKELESIKEPFYPEKYPQGTIFAYQFQSMHPAIVHFIASLPLIPVLTPLNVYESKHSELNKKRALIRSRDEHLLIFGKIKVLSLLFSNETKADKVVGIMREHSHSATANFIALNTASYPVTVHFDLRDLQFKHEPTPETIFEVIDVVTNKRELMTYNELKNERIMVKLDALDMSCLHVNIYKPRHNVNVNVEHQQYSVKRAINLLESNTPANGNSVYESIADCMKKNDAKGLCNYLQRLYKMLNDVTHKTEVSKLVNMLHLLFYNINQIDGLRDRITPVIGSDVLNNASRISNIGGEICQQVLTKK
ncbi:Starch synthase [Entamoeba marina]